jgi:hypothetical protein
MSKDPYKIVDTKPSWSSKLGSGVVALGSVATAIVITVPGLPGYQLLSEANDVINGTNPIGGQTTSGDTNAVDLGASETQTSNSANSGNVALTGNSNSATAQTPIQSVLAGPKSSPSQPSTQLSLPGVSSGNTTSPTPGTWSGNGSNANAGGNTATGNTTSPTPGSSGGSNANTNPGGNTSSGNTTSPTPGGGGSEYEEDEEEEDEEEEEDDD